MGLYQPGLVKNGPCASRCRQPKTGPVLATGPVALPSTPARAATSEVITFATEPAWKIPFMPVLSGQGP